MKIRMLTLMMAARALWQAEGYLSGLSPQEADDFHLKARCSVAAASLGVAITTSVQDLDVVERDAENNLVHLDKEPRLFLPVVYRSTLENVQEVLKEVMDYFEEHRTRPQGDLYSMARKGYSALSVALMGGVK